MALLGLLFLRDGRREGQQLFSYLFRVAPNLDRSAIEETVRQVIPETEEVVMTLAEQLIQQGLSQGKSLGKRGIVRRLLELKFGSLSQEVVSLLDSADEATLERYAERLLTAATVAEVFGE